MVINHGVLERASRCRRRRQSRFNLSRGIRLGCRYTVHRIVTRDGSCLVATNTVAQVHAANPSCRIVYRMIRSALLCRECTVQVVRMGMDNPPVHPAERISGFRPRDPFYPAIRSPSSIVPTSKSPGASRHDLPRPPFTWATGIGMRGGSLHPQDVLCNTSCGVARSGVKLRALTVIRADR